TVTAAAGATAVWVLWHAFSTGFRPRAGVPMSANFPATLIAVGVLALVVAYVYGRHRSISRLLVVGGLGGLLYTTLLLGSRGVLVALVLGAAWLLTRAKPSWKQVLDLFTGVLVALAIVVLIAVLLGDGPIIPRGFAL